MSQKFNLLEPEMRFLWFEFELEFLVLVQENPNVRNHPRLVLVGYASIINKCLGLLEFTVCHNHDSGIAWGYIADSKRQHCPCKHSYRSQKGSQRDRILI